MGQVLQVWCPQAHGLVDEHGGCARAAAAAWTQRRGRLRCHAWLRCPLGVNQLTPARLFFNLSFGRTTSAQACLGFRERESVRRYAQFGALAGTGRTAIATLRVWALHHPTFGRFSPAVVIHQKLQVWRALAIR